MRAAYNADLPRVTDFWTRLGSDERLYAKYKAIDPSRLGPEQRQALKNAVRNFVLGGAELQGSAKERFAEIQERQAEVSQKFSENSLDATDAFAYYASREELAGVPEDVVVAARAAAEAARAATAGSPIGRNGRRLRDRYRLRHQLGSRDRGVVRRWRNDRHRGLRLSQR